MKITRTATAILSIAMLAILTSDAMAQPGDGERGRRGRSPGMRGGAMRGGSELLSLLRIDEVRQELEMQPAQQEAVEKIVQRAREAGRPDSEFNFREASEEERREMFEKMREQQREVAKKAETQLQEVLLPAQYNRLEEIGLQVQGVRALNDPDVAGKLNVTDQQKQEMREVAEQLRETMRERVREIMQSGDRDQMRTIFRKLREKSEEQVLAVLTEEQRARFEEMQGEPFEMPEFAGRRGPGGRDGFRGRGGRRGSGDGPGSRRGDRRGGGGQEDDGDNR